MPAERRSRAVATVLLLTALAACSDEQHQQSDTNQTSAASEQVNATDAWLELQDDTPPVEWLLARAKAKGRFVSEANVTLLKQSISTAVLRLGESARMIANRAVQLEVMMKSKGFSESAEALIPALTNAVGETGQTEGFGAVSQHYYNMRSAGLTSEQALDDLRRRYGPRGG